MTRFRLWDKTSNANMMGTIHTPQQLMQAYPAQTDGDCVLEYVSASVVGGIDNLEMLATAHGVTALATAQETLDAIIYKIENPEPIPASAEERIASSLEYQNMLTL